MRDIIEIYYEFRGLGIINRSITEGKEIDLVRDYVAFRKESFKASQTKKVSYFYGNKSWNLLS